MPTGDGKRVQNYGVPDHGAVRRWASSARVSASSAGVSAGSHSHMGPLYSPNADATPSQKAYNVAAGGADESGGGGAGGMTPQKRTFINPTTEGNQRHEFSQARPMAKDSSGSGANWAMGITSQRTGATGYPVESRLMFEGTVSSTDMSLATDAREKQRIGVFGTDLSYAGSYGRVTSESIGRDLNPLGRGAGQALVGGEVALGSLWRQVPKGIAYLGRGNSINNNFPCNCCSMTPRACLSHSLGDACECNDLMYEYQHDCCQPRLGSGSSWQHCQNLHCSILDCMKDRKCNDPCGEFTLEQYELGRKQCCHSIDNPPSSGSNPYPPMAPLNMADYTPLVPGSKTGPYVHKNCSKKLYRYIIEQGWKDLINKISGGTCLCKTNTDLRNCLQSAISIYANSLFISCDCAAEYLSPYAARTRGKFKDGQVIISLCPEVWTAHKIPSSCDVASELLHELTHACDSNTTSMSMSLNSKCGENGLATRCQVDCFSGCQGTNSNKWGNNPNDAYNPSNCCCCG
jgi:hypothetical protein